MDKHRFVADIMRMFRAHLGRFNLARLATGGSGTVAFGRSESALVEKYKVLLRQFGEEHAAMSSFEREHNYLVQVSTLIAALILPGEDYGAEITSHMLSRMTVTKAIEPAVSKFCDPDFLYLTLIDILSDDPPDKPAGPYTQPETASSPETAGRSSSAAYSPLPSPSPSPSPGPTVDRPEGEAETEAALHEAASTSADWVGIQAPSQGLDLRKLHKSLASSRPRPGAKQKYTEGLPLYTVEITSVQVLYSHAEYYLHIKSSDGVTHGNVAPESWNISRRFKEFTKLHRLLGAKFPIEMRHIVLPSTNSTAFNSKDLVPAKLETRRVLLDSYLQSIIGSLEIAKSFELCQFLSNRSVLFPNEREVERDGLGKVTGIAAMVRRGIGTIASQTLKRLRQPPWVDASTEKEVPSTLMFVKRKRRVASDAGHDGGAGALFDNYLSQFASGAGGRAAVEEAGGSTASTTDAESAGNYVTTSRLRMALKMGPAADDMPLPDRSIADHGYAELGLAMMLEAFGWWEWARRWPKVLAIVANISAGAAHWYLSEKMKYLGTEMKLNTYVETLIETLTDEDEPERSAAEMAQTKGEAFKAVMTEAIPPLMMKLLGEKKCGEASLLFLASIGQAEINRHLVYSTIDIALAHLVPELAAVTSSEANAECPQSEDDLAAAKAAADLWKAF